VVADLLGKRLGELLAGDVVPDGVEAGAVEEG
jgi:hypothetical protein